MNFFTYLTYKLKINQLFFDCNIKKFHTMLDSNRSMLSVGMELKNEQLIDSIMHSCTAIKRMCVRESVNLPQLAEEYDRLISIANEIILDALEFIRENPKLSKEDLGIFK